MAASPVSADGDSSWSCDDGTVGLLYQVALTQDGSTNVYRYVKNEGSTPLWNDVLVAEVEGMPEGFVLNALTLTPEGTMYAVLSSNGGSNDRYDLVRVEAPQDGSTTTTFTKMFDTNSLFFVFRQF